jgi:acetylornithine deacetylase/succinyl-diaminopimelate desuccinylase-like protein
MKALIFGPGSIQQTHIPDEFIEAQKLYEFAPILEKIVKDQCCRP